MLPTPWTLHDVDDVEAAVQNTIEDYLRRHQAWLPDHHREDLAQFLLGVVCEIAPKHNPAITSFSQRLYRTCSLRIVDWYRHTFQDLRAAKPELPLSLDGPANLNGDAADGPSRSLIEALADETCQGDLAAQMGGDSLVRWLRGDRDRLATQADPSLDRPTDRRTPDAARAA
jgi:hypothetical protein